MKVNIIGAVCPKNWKVIGRDGKSFTIVSDNTELSIDNIINLEICKLLIRSQGKIVDNGRKYKVSIFDLPEGNNHTDGIKVAYLKNIEGVINNDIKNINIVYENDEEERVEGEQVSDTITQKPAKKSLLRRIINWF